MSDHLEVGDDILVSVLLLSVLHIQERATVSSLSAFGCCEIQRTGHFDVLIQGTHLKSSRI